MTAVGDGSGDASDLLGRLPLTVDHFREPLARGAVMVDACEPEVLDRFTHQPFEGMPLGVGRVDLAVADRVEKRPEGTGPRARMRGMVLICQGLVFDSAESASIELGVVPGLGLLIL